MGQNKKKEKILVIEDSRTQATCLKDLLTKMDWEVISTPNAHEALIYLKTNKPDLIISDVVMPGLSGFALTRLLKNNYIFKNIPIILLTSLSTPTDIIEGLKCNADSFISKPYTDHMLTTRIKQLLDKDQIKQRNLINLKMINILNDLKEQIPLENIINFILLAYEDANIKAVELNTLNSELKKLIEERKKLATVVENSIDLIFILSISGDLLYINKAGVDFIELDIDKLNSITVSELLTKADMAILFDKIIPQTLRSGSWNGEIKLKEQKTNKEIPALLSSFKIVNDDKTLGIGFICHDMTTIKKYENEIINARDQALIAQISAENASKAKSEFLANMSHELRTPLNSIIGFSQVLDKKYFGNLNEKQIQYVNNILESGNHLLNLINDILDISKIEAKKMTLELSQIELKKLLKNSFIMIKEKCYNHNISLELKLPKEMEELYIVADEIKIKQIMYNLLSNAAKFTPDKGVIQVSARINTNDINISVKDSGIGISKDNLSKIFDEFYQIPNKESGKSKGTGLGLTLIKNLVEMHGGTVKVKSKGLNMGSTFSFTLPIKQGG